MNSHMGKNCSNCGASVSECDEGIKQGKACCGACFIRDTHELIEKPGPNDLDAALAVLRVCAERGGTLASDHAGVLLHQLDELKTANAARNNLTKVANIISESLGYGPAHGGKIFDGDFWDMINEAARQLRECQ